jgi:FkbM family methyltransferase
MTTYDRHILARIIRRTMCQGPSARTRDWVNHRFRKLCADGEVVVKTRHGFRILASPHDYVSHRIFFYSEYDEQMSNFIIHQLREGQVAWDVGTERGWFSLLMATLVGNNGRVDSFEAFPPTAEKLRQNIALNSATCIRPNQVAVSDVRGMMWFVPPQAVSNTSISSRDHNGGVGYLTNTQELGAIQVPTITLDEYASETQLEALHFIKMDIEGAEVSALSGASQVISRFRPVLAVEYSTLTAARAGSSVANLDDLLEDYGYDRYVFSRGFKRLDLNREVDRQGEDLVINVYCFPRERGIS